MIIMDIIKIIINYIIIIDDDDDNDDAFDYIVILH